MPSEPSERDRLLAETAIQRGVVSSDEIEECLSLQKRLLATGQQVELGQILIRRRLVDSSTLAQLLKSTRRKSAELPRLDRYEIVRQLGAGGMAVVYEGRDRQLGRRVAIKALQEGVHSRDSGPKRFLREARAIARLSHPNVVTVHDVVQTEGRMYLVMEFVEGEPLSESAGFRESPLRRRIEVFEQVARGIHHAHEAGIVHRDLKPANIVLGADGAPKILDFGLAHLTDAETVLTRSEATLGTPRYMAPEQVKGGGKAISPRTDVFALGVILYESLTGRLPHEGESAMEVYARICNVDPEPPRRIRPEVPRELEAIVLKALEKDPARRYQTAELLATDLRRWLDGEPVAARPSSLLARAWRKGLRHRAVLAPAIAAGALVGCFAVLAALSWRERARRIDEALEAAARSEDQGDLDRARNCYRIALELDDDHDAATAGLARTTEAIELRDRTREEFRRRAIEEARAQEEAIKVLETGRPALEKATRYLYDRNFDPGELARRVEQGFPLLERAVALAPGMALGHLLVARAWELRGRLELAETSLRRAIELQPGLASARERLGHVLLERAWFASLSSAERAAPLLAEAAAEIEASLGRSDEIEDVLGREVASAKLAYCRGDAEAVRGVVSRALARYERQFGSEELHWLRGLVSDDAEAALSLTSALEVRPHYPLALVARALARRRSGREEEARADLAAALAATPSDWTYRAAVEALLR